MSYATRFFGFSIYTDETKKAMEIYLIVSMVSTLALYLSNTFYILFLIGEIGYQNASLILAITALVQFFFDYPSGSLGDKIGQKRVLISAHILYLFSFALLYFSTVLLNFVGIAIIRGLANSQVTGTLSSWLDNRYRQNESPDSDPERRNYGFTKHRFHCVLAFTLAIVYTLGGFLSTLFSRRNVFLLQLFINFFVIIIILILLKEKPKCRDLLENMSGNESNSYFKYLKMGIRFVISTKMTFFLFTGMAIFYVAWSVWMSLLAFPIFFGYTGSDSYSSLVRALGIFIGVFFQVMTSNLTKKISEKSFTRIMFLHGLYYLPFIILVLLFPLDSSFHLYLFVIMIILEIIFNKIIWPIALALYERIIIDLVPSNIRNGVYSIEPTLIAMLRVPFLLLTGYLVETYDLISGIILVFILALTSTCFLLIAQNQLNKVNLDQKTRQGTT